MHDQSDVQLLRDYAERGQDAAFRELVTRYADLVFSAALRQVESPDLAADITQNIFIALARKARSVSEQLAAPPSLVGWLHRSTRFAALNHLRDNQRRASRERQAMEQLLTNCNASADWEEVRPILDEALDSLGDEDRNAVLLRYFKNHDLRTIGATFGISDDTAQKRVSRAVERLREFFAKRGVTVGASGLAVLISGNAVQAAPVGLALTISTAAALTGTTIATTATLTATKAIAMTALQKTLVAATIAVLAGVGIYEARQAAQFRDQVQTLQQQQAPMARQLEQLQGEREEATHRLSSAAAEISQWKSGQNLAELLKLRGQVGLLAANARANSPAKVMASMVNDPAQKELARLQIQQALHARYDPLVGELNLAPEIADKIGGLIIENELSKKDRLAALIRGELNVESASQDRDNAKREMEREITAILGDSAYAQFKQFNRDADAKAFVKIINDQLGQNALNTEQRKSLQALVTDQPGVTVDDIDLFRSKESLDAIYQDQFERAQSILPQAASFLTPEQAAAVRRINSNYWNEVRIKMTLYQQLINNTISSSNR